MDDFNLEDTLAEMVKQGLMTERWNEEQDQFEYMVTPLGTKTFIAHRLAERKKDE